MRVLDLGCGVGTSLTDCGGLPSDDVVGVDLQLERLAIAAQTFPNRTFVQAVGEFLPFSDDSFQRLVCQVALPYMNIPAALAEANRILQPAGTTLLTPHALRFTL